MNSNRAVIIDRWMNKDGKRTGRYGVGMRWRARFVDDQGREQTRAFAHKVDARAWLDDVITAPGLEQLHDARGRARHRGVCLPGVVGHPGPHQPQAKSHRPRSCPRR